MRYKKKTSAHWLSATFIFSLLTITGIAFFLTLIGRKPKLINEESFAYLGNPYPFDSIDVLNKTKKTFYVASGKFQDKTSTFVINEDKINEAISSGTSVINGLSLVTQLVPERTENAKYDIKFKQNAGPIIIFSRCGGKTEKCYLNSIETLVKNSLNRNNPESVDSNQILIEKQQFEIVEAKPKKNSSDKGGCQPINFTLIKYNENWYTLSSAELCSDQNQGNPQ